jgi:hypothetical protein
MLATAFLRAHILQRAFVKPLMGFVDSPFPLVERRLAFALLSREAGLGPGEDVRLLRLLLFGRRIEGLRFRGGSDSKVVVKLLFPGGEILDRALEPVQQGERFSYPQVAIHSLF